MVVSQMGGAWYSYHIGTNAIWSGLQPVVVTNSDSQSFSTFLTSGELESCPRKLYRVRWLRDHCANSIQLRALHTIPKLGGILWYVRATSREEPSRLAYSTLLSRIQSFFLSQTQVLRDALFNLILSILPTLLNRNTHRFCERIVKLK